MRARSVGRRAIWVALPLVLGLLAAPAHAQERRDVYTIDLSAVECFEVIGRAPEHREVMRRHDEIDRGPAQAFVVRIPDRVVADIRATYTDIEPAAHPGFEHFRSSAIRFGFGDDDPGGFTQILPRDRFVMFTMGEDIVADLAQERPRCGSRIRFDRKPFEAMYRRVRDTLRQMLDQQPR